MKYKLTTETINVFGVTLFRIEALTFFGNVSIGEKGGFIEKESNVDQYGDARVYGNAILKLKGHNNCKTYLTIGPIGSDRFITIEKEHKMINAGCFSGTVNEFEKAVRDKYGDDSDYYPVNEFIKSILK